MSTQQTQSESLAVFLARLRPGDRCVCCGAALQPLAAGGRRTRPGAGPPDLRAVVGVCCPACGCEVAEEASGDAGEGLRELGTAA
jgi:hypothetical protein